MKRILVPTDFSVPSQAALKFAVNLAAKMNGDVYLVHFIELPGLPETTFGIQTHSLDSKVLQKATDAATKSFESMKKLLAPNVPVYFKAIKDHVVSGIRAFIEDNGIDLIVMSTHGASDLQEFFIGSTAEKIARFAPVPLISIPREIEIDSIKNIVFPSTLELDQEDLMKDLRDLQTLLNAKLHVLLVNTPLNFYNEQQARKSLEKFARHYKLQDFTLNFRSHQFERSGIIEFMNEIKGDIIAMATHGRTGLAHFFKGSIAESVLNRIDHPIWTWKLQDKK